MTELETWIMARRLVEMSHEDLKVVLKNDQDSNLLQLAFKDYEPEWIKNSLEEFDEMHKLEAGDVVDYDGEAYIVIVPEGLASDCYALLMSTGFGFLLEKSKCVKTYHYNIPWISQETVDEPIPKIQETEAHEIEPEPESEIKAESKQVVLDEDPFDLFC